MTIAVGFFAVVAVIIVGGLVGGALGALRVRWMTAGYELGRAEACEREVAAALRLERAHRAVSVCDPPPLDWAAMERGRR